MSDSVPLEPIEGFFPLLIENYIRLESIVTCLKNADENGNYPTLPTKFKISKDYFEQVKNYEIQSPFLGINFEYDDSSETLTATPDEFALELYKNKIMHEVALKQDNDFQNRYSKYISVIK